MGRASGVVVVLALALVLALVLVLLLVVLCGCCCCWTAGKRCWAVAAAAVGGGEGGA